MKEIRIQYFKTRLGELILGSFGDELCLCDWRYRSMREIIDKRIRQTLECEYIEEKSGITDDSIGQLTEYLGGTREAFSVPFRLTGSPFQVSVWNELLKIPYGTTENYLQLARRLGDEKAIRAVAAANGANAIAIIVPCHRIIGSNREMTGYAGGIKAKKELLKIESKGRFPEQLELF